MSKPRKTVDNRIRITKRRGVYRLYRRKDGTGHAIYYPTTYSTTDRSVAEKWARELEIEEAKERIEAAARKADAYADHRSKPLYQLDEDSNLVGGHLFDLIETLRTAGRSKKHVRDTRERTLKVLIAAKITTWDQLDATLVQVTIAGFRYRTQRAGKRRYKKPEARPTLLNQTRRYYLRAVRQFSAWLVAQNRAPRDPLYGLKPNRVWKSNAAKHPRDVLTENQFQQLIATTYASQTIVEDYDGRTRALLYLLAVGLGFRRRELSSLTSQNFRGLDGKQPLASLEPDWSKHRQEDELRLDARLAQMVKARFDSLPPGSRLFPGLITDENEKDTAKMIQRDLAEAGLPYKTEQGKFLDFHSLRHYYCTGCVRAAAKAGIPLKAVLKLTRHSSVELLSRYTHTDDEETETIRRGLPALPIPEGLA
jgi:site-specific recombinase XerC